MKITKDSTMSECVEFIIKHTPPIVLDSVSQYLDKALKNMDRNHAYLNTPLHGKGALWGMATVENGEFAGKTVCILVEYSDGECIVDFGMDKNDEDSKIGIINIKDMRLWKNVQSVG